MKKKMCLIRRTWNVALLVSSFSLLGCFPRKRSCVDTITSGCVLVGTRLNVRCCHMGAMYNCDFIFTETQRVEAVIACQCLESLGVLVLQEDAERMALTLAGDIPMLGRRFLLVGALLFFGAYFFTTAWLIVRPMIWTYFEPYFACRYNLKALWVLSQKVSRRYQAPFPPPVRWIKMATKKTVMLTEREANYLGMSEWVGSYVDFPLSLICPRDPKYLLKVAMDSQGLDYEPSYLWHPDNRTLAYCPYCRLAVLLDGKIEKR
ncbi:MAG: hypothetical protein HZLCBSQH_001339 [Candidatus Fervidibacterota bacterium]